MLYRLAGHFTHKTKETQCNTIGLIAVKTWYLYAVFCFCWYICKCEFNNFNDRCLVFPCSCTTRVLTLALRCKITLVWRDTTLLTLFLLQSKYMVVDHSIVWYTELLSFTSVAHTKQTTMTVDWNTVSRYCIGWKHWPVTLEPST